MKNRISLFMAGICCAAFLFSCSKDSERPSGLPPEIILGQESPFYQVKAGKSITLAPVVENAGNDAAYLWKIANRIVGREKTYTYRAGNEPLILYVMFEVTNHHGTAEQEFSIEVVSEMKPRIALGVPEGGYKVIIDGELKFTPEVTNGDNAQFAWTVDGLMLAATKDFTFPSRPPGNYAVVFTATNEDGSDKVEFNVKVCSPEEMPFTAYFEQTTYNMALGRTIFIRPYRVENAFDAVYTWTVDGQVVTPPPFSNTRVATTEGAACTFAYTPTETGVHTVIMTMSNEYGVVPVSFTVNVSEAQTESPRGYTGEISANKVFEFTAAPGQFVNEGYNAVTPQEAITYAANSMMVGNPISLGAWGGYLVVGFDHSIRNDRDYNLQILGNAFKGGSEQGIVWVMQDENGNGLPDDTWYELKGSDYEISIQDYAVTYYRPGGPDRPVAWTDNRGAGGQVDYLGFHRQDYYYPNWITADSYTLVGSCLASKVSGGGGSWTGGESAWGYADNFSPVDQLTDESNPNAGVMGNHMRISDAVCHDGRPANLPYIDFVKVHTGINAKAGWLGEISTEIVGVQDYNLIKNK